MVPDGPLLLSLSLAALFLSRALGDPDGRDWPNWLGAGVCLGLALLSKYQAVPVAAGAAIVLLLPANRHWLRRPQPYVAALLALLFAIPVIAWNAENGWISFGFQLGRGGGGRPFEPTRLLALLAGEAIYLLPWVLVGLVVAAIRGVGRSGGSFFLALGVPSILLFNLLPLIGPAGLPHWSMAGWLFLFPLLGDALAAAQENSKRWPGYLGAASVVTMAIVGAGAVGLLSDWRVMSAGSDADRYLVEATSWTGVRDCFAAERLLDRPRTFLAATSWLDEALRPPRPPVVFGDDPRGFAFLDNPNAHLGEDAYFVVASDDVAAIKDFAMAHFDSVDDLGSLQTWKGGMPAYAHTVLLAHRLRQPVPVPYGIR